MAGINTQISNIYIQESALSGLNISNLIVLNFVNFTWFEIKRFIVSAVLGTKIQGRVFALIVQGKYVNEYQVYSKNGYFTPAVYRRVIKQHLTVQMCGEE